MELRNISTNKETKMGKRLVFIHSVYRETATKVSNFTDPDTGKNLKKTKMGDCKDGIQALYSHKIGGLKNGLSYKPWTENGKPVLRNGRALTLQDKMEEKWGLEPGYLTNRPWRKGDSVAADKMTYYQTKSWKLRDGTTMLDLDNFDDEMFYHVCLDSKLVANSERELKERKWPDATHYISLENEDQEIKHARKKRIRTAIKRMEDSKVMTIGRKLEFVYILGLSSTKTRDISEETVDNLLDEYINTSAGNTPDNIDRFNELYLLATEQAGRDELKARLLLKQAEDYRVVYEKQGSYTWNRSKGAITLGDTYSEAIGFIINPKKDVLVQELEQELKAAMI